MVGFSGPINGFLRGKLGGQNDPWESLHTRDVPLMDSKELLQHGMRVLDGRGASSVLSGRSPDGKVTT